MSLCLLVHVLLAVTAQPCNTGGRSESCYNLMVLPAVLGCFGNPANAYLQATKVNMVRSAIAAFFSGLLPWKLQAVRAGLLEPVQAHRCSVRHIAQRISTYQLEQTSSPE